MTYVTDNRWRTIRKRKTVQNTIGPVNRGACTPLVTGFPKCVSEHLTQLESLPGSKGCAPLAVRTHGPASHSGAFAETYQRTTSFELLQWHLSRRTRLRRNAVVDSCALTLPTTSDSAAQLRLRHHKLRLGDWDGCAQLSLLAQQPSERCLHESHEMGLLELGSYGVEPTRLHGDY